MPEEDPISAIIGLEELHVPPPASVRVMDEPAQTEVGPEMAPGKGFTVNGNVV